MVQVNLYTFPSVYCKVEIFFNFNKMKLPLIPFGIQLTHLKHAHEAIREVSSSRGNWSWDFKNSSLDSYIYRMIGSELEARALTLHLDLETCALVFQYDFSEMPHQATSSHFYPTFNSTHSSLESKSLSGLSIQSSCFRHKAGSMFQKSFPWHLNLARTGSILKIHTRLSSWWIISTT